jgi:peptide/nickel transport system substrate-binding protein
MRPVAATAALALAALALAGCAPTSLVVEGSTVTVASGQPFTSYNDQTAYGSSAANAAVVGATNAGFSYYDDASALVRDESFGHYEIVSQEPFSVRYTVNAGVLWSDGEPVDGADLLLAWAANSGHRNTEGFDPARYVDWATGLFEPFPADTVYFDGASHSGLQYVSAVPEIGDDGRSITLVYDEFFVDWELAFDVGLPAHVVAQAVEPQEDSEASTAGALAKEWLIDAIQTDDVASLAPLAQVWNQGFTAEGELPFVGSGPYAISEIVPAESVTLTANPLYSGDRLPHYETVIVRTITDPLAAVVALRDGEVDVIAPTPSAEVTGALDAVDGIVVESGASSMFEHLDLQFSDGKNATFTDPLLREAFLATVPVAEIAEAAEAEVRTSFVFAEAGEASAPDIAKAKRLIAEAGATAPPVCILFDPSNPRRVDEFQLVKASAEKAGFLVGDCSQSDWEGFLGVRGAYDAALFAWNETTAAVSAPAARLQSASTVSNFSHYASEEVDALLAELAVTTDPAAQRDLLEQVDAALTADAYGLPLYQFPALVAHADSVQGPRNAPLGAGLLWNVWNWQPAENAG